MWFLFLFWCQNMNIPLNPTDMDYSTRGFILIWPGVQLQVLGLQPQWLQQQLPQKSQNLRIDLNSARKVIIFFIYCTIYSFYDSKIGIPSLPLQYWDIILLYQRIKAQTWFKTTSYLNLKNLTKWTLKPNWPEK